MEKIPRDKESVRKLMQLKKDRLLHHLPFIREMITKLQKTELQVKWRSVHDGILSNRKLFSLNQINNFDATVTRLREQQDKRHTKETVVIEEMLKIPVPTELGKPPLSDNEFQELIEDLTGHDDSSLSKSPSPEPKRRPSAPKETQEKLQRFKELHKKQKIMLRRSSCFPTKFDEKTIGSFPEELIAQSTLKAPFKIPKVTPSPNASPSAPETKQSPQLKPIDIFKSVKENSVKLSEDPTSPDEIAKLKDEKETKSSTVEAPATSEVCTKKRKSEAADEVEKSMDKLFSEAPEPTTPNPPSKPARRSSFSKVSTELRRLQMNIVKDDSPLPSRRSCSLKRNSAGKDSPATEEDDTPKAKRGRPSLKSEDKKSATKAESRILFGKPAKSSPVPVAVPERVQAEPKPTGRSTRRSAAASAVGQKEEVKTPRGKRARQSKSPVYSSSDDIPLKPCSVKLTDTVKSPEKVNKSPMTPTRQVAMKSTNQRQEIAAKTGDKTAEAVSQPVDHPAESKTPEVQKEIPKPVTLIYKNIQNIAFTKCRNGAIRKCLVQACRYQTLEKHTFVKHLEVRHNATRWNGYCNICLKMVMRDKDGLSLFNEFLHMEDHLYEEKASTAEIAIVKKSPTPEKSFIKSTKASPLPEPVVKKLKNSSKDEPDPEMVKGLDSLLDVLCPSEKNKTMVMERPIVGEVVQIQPKPSTVFKVFSRDGPKKLIPNSTPFVVNNPLVPGQTKVVAKNIVGRVIPMSQLQGVNGKLLFGQGFKVQLPANSLKLNLPQNTIKIPATTAAKMPIVSPKPNGLQMNKVHPTVHKITKNVPINVSSTLREVTVPNSLNTVPNFTKPQDSAVQKCTAPPPIRPTDPMRFEEVLRPWLGVKSKKNDTSVEVLLSKNALSATYKCMGKNCMFFTIDSNLFGSHLAFHEQFTLSDKLFLGCSYCRFEGTSISELIQHVNKEHGCDAFQCAFCFYRSLVDFNVITHQDSYHVMRPRIIIKVNVRRKKEFSTELEIVKRNRVETVPPIFCVCRKAQFYIFKSFLEHIKDHSTIVATTCSKCKQKTNASTIHTHLVQCHGYGLFQCVYCRFGTNNRVTISQHLANEHPSKMPFFCERIERSVTNDPMNPGSNDKACDPSSIESTCLKHIKQNVTPSCFVEAPDDEIVLRNYSNIGDLGQNIRVQGIMGGKGQAAKLIPQTIPAVQDASKQVFYKPFSKPICVQPAKKPVYIQHFAKPPAMTRVVVPGVPELINPVRPSLQITKLQVPVIQSDTVVKLSAKPAPSPRLRSSQIREMMQEAQQTKAHQPSVKVISSVGLQKPVRVRTTAELQEPAKAKTMTMSDILFSAAETATPSPPPVTTPPPAPAPAQTKRVSIFAKQPDPSKHSTLRKESWPSWAMKPEYKGPTQMPDMTQFSHKPSLTQGAPKPLLRGSDAHQTSTVQASASLTAGEILMKDDGTPLIKEEPVEVEEEEDEAPPQPFGLQIENVFSYQDVDNSDWKSGFDE